MPFAEFDARPQAVIIHDPVKNGSFKVIEKIDDSGSLEEKVLFRSRPDTDLYSRQHKMFADLLRRHAEKVFYLEDLVGKS